MSRRGAVKFYRCQGSCSENHTHSNAGSAAILWYYGIDGIPGVNPGQVSQSDLSRTNPLRLRGTKRVRNHRVG